MKWRVEKGTSWARPRLKFYFAPSVMTRIGIHFHPPLPSLRQLWLRILRHVVSYALAISIKVSVLLLPPPPTVPLGPHPPPFPDHSISLPRDGSPPAPLGDDISVPHQSQWSISGHLSYWLTTYWWLTGFMTYLLSLGSSPRSNRAAGRLQLGSGARGVIMVEEQRPPPLVPAWCGYTPLVELGSFHVSTHMQSLPYTHMSACSPIPSLWTGGILLFALLALLHAGPPWASFPVPSSLWPPQLQKIFLDAALFRPTIPWYYVITASGLCSARNPVK